MSVSEEPVVFMVPAALQFVVRQPRAREVDFRG
jgi:hypothetical protein